MLRQKVWNQILVRSFSATGTGLNLTHSSQLRVVSTNQWPIPYYKREAWYPRSLYPENDYNISMVGNDCSEPDSANVYLTQLYLNESMWGREVLDTVHKQGNKGDLNTVIKSPVMAADVYTEDLMRHLDYSLKENAKILKKHKLSEIFN